MLSSVFGFFTRNLGIKLLALLMACMVYAHVFTEKEQAWDISAPLILSNAPEGLVLASEPPAEVRLTVRGPGKQLLKLRVDPPEVLVDLRSASPGNVQRFLSPSDVSLPPGAEIEVARIVEPRMVTLELDTLVTRALPVRVPLLGATPPHLSLSGPVGTVPERVEATGPSRVLDRLQITSDPFHLEQLEVLEETRLAIRSNLEGGVLVPTEVGLTGTLVRIGQRTLPSLPIQVEGKPDGLLVSVEPETVRVTVNGPESGLNLMAAADLHVRLNASALPPGRHMLTPEVRLPGPEYTVISVHPLRFVVEIREP